MAGGYCRITKTKGTAITTVGAMLFAVFAVGVLICSSEYEGTPDKPFESTQLKADKDIGKIQMTITTDQPIQAAFVSSIVICVLGMIFGILIMFSPQTLSKPVYIAWMVFGVFATISLFILGVFIAAKHDPVGIISFPAAGENSQNATTPIPDNNTTILSTATTPTTTTTQNATTNLTTTATPTATATPTTTKAIPPTVSAETSTTPADTANLQKSVSEQNATSPGSTQNAASSDEKSPAGRSRRSETENMTLAFPVGTRMTFPRDFLISPIYLLCSCVFLIWTVVATGLSMNDITS